MQRPRGWCAVSAPVPAGPRYCFSSDGERFDGDCDTREAALAQGISESSDHKRRPVAIHTGVAVPFDEWHVFAENVLEQMQEQAYDEVGECSEGWLSDVTKEAHQELEDQLNAVVDAWLTKHGHTPHFFSVNDIEVHPLAPESHQ